MPTTDRLFRRMQIASMVMIVTSFPLSCQETSATVAGQVKDSSGGLIAGATITVRNLNTNALLTTKTNSSGLFEIPFVVNGKYELRATAKGFREYIRSQIDVAAGNHLELNIALDVGEAAAAVTVDETTPLLDTTTGTASQVLDNRLVQGLPVSSNSSFLLASLAAGMQRTSFLNFNSHTVTASSAQGTAGGAGGNEVFLDGIPNSGQQRRVAYLPFTEAIEETHVETMPFDASLGNSIGAFITQISRAGTNAFHGSISDTHWQERWNAATANDIAAYNAPIVAAEQAGNTALVNQLRSQPKQQAGHSNTYAATLAGPVILPRLFNGRNKLFFFFLYQGQKDRFHDLDSTRQLYTVPTAAQRNGDFSQLLAFNAAEYQIYDPLTTRFDSASGLFVRQPFPGNQIPANRFLNPLIKAYNTIYPLPNGSPAADAEGHNNYFADPEVKYDYFALHNRLDYVVTEADRFFVRWSYNKFFDDRNDWTYQTVPGLASEALDRRNTNIGLDWVHIFSGSTVLNLTVGYNRFPDNRPLNPVEWSYKPSDVGLPAYLDTKAVDLHTLPQVAFTSYTTIGDQRVIPTPTSTSSLRANLARNANKHSLFFGYEGRVYYSQGGDSGVGYPGYTSGQFTFTNNLVRGSSAASNVGTLGTEYAAFLLGIPSTTRVDTNTTYYATTPRHGFFAQDTFRVSPRFTFTLGLRSEIELGIKEQHNRALRDFDPSAQLAITADAEKAYATNPLAEVRASSFKVLGGVRYLGVGGVSERYTNTTYRLLPRVGFAYSLNAKTVMRGGYGLYYDTLNSSLFFLNQFGFNRSTITNITNDQGVTWNYGYFTNNNPPISDPFPVRADGTRFDVPFGSALGVDSLSGSSFSFISPNFQPAKQHRARIELERRLPSSIVVGASYNFSYIGNYGVNKQLNALPAQYWATGDVRNNAIQADLNRAVTNPFYIGNFGDLRTSNPLLYQQMSTAGFFNSPTIAKNQLLRPYPQLTSLIEQQAPIGEFRYDSLILRLEKRYTFGFVFNANYEWSHSRSRDYFANEFDAIPSWRESDLSRPQRFVITSVYELPFGKGKPFLSKSGILQALAGGWQTSSTFQAQSGPALNFSNLFYYGNNWRDIELPASQRTIARWFNTANFQTNSALAPASFNTSQFPATLNWLRAAPLVVLDSNLQKTVTVSKLSATLRGDFLNALNHQVPDAPSTNPLSATFGRVTTYVNNPRVIQITLRIAF
jgi:hypothetical protein